MHTHRILVALAPLVLFAAATAQTPVKYAVTPAGYEFQTGGSNNTYPLGRVAASYQQIHDATDMAGLNGGQAMIFSGMHFRPAQAYAITARSFDVQITLSVTTTTAATMSTTFSANFGPSTTVVLPFTSMNLPSGAGTNGNPNAPLWLFPFKTIFPYAPASGNLCWDWRQKNSSSTTSAFFDFVGSTPSIATLASAGTGCTATGQSIAATSTISQNGANLVAALRNGRANSPAFAALGVARAPVPLWCGTLYVAPALLVGGMTDASGNWTAATFPASILNFAPYSEAFLQYAFADAGLTGLVGLSNYAVGGSPANGVRYIARLWEINTETATTGAKATNGLVTMFTML